MKIDHQLKSGDCLTQLILKKGITTWNALIKITQQLPYGRNSNRTDFSLVITEAKGSCSSKHAFLKKVADLNNIPNIKLILGMYKMSEINTPGIGTTMSDNNILFIPEAHCYLSINNNKTDITSENADFSALTKDLIQEIEIKPEQVSQFKVSYHKKYLKSWIKENEISFSFDELWTIREQCITNLSK